MTDTPDPSYRDQVDQPINNSAGALDASATFNLGKKQASSSASSSGADLLQPGFVIDGRYHVIEPIGHGGMGTIYKVERIFFSDTAALKLNSCRLTQVSGKRFQREAKAAEMLDHPGLVKVFDFGLLNDEIPYFVMEYLQGQSVADLIQEKGPIPVPTALTIFQQVCQAMAYAHERGVVHRDLKPSNIMLVQTGGKPKVKVVDFGIAKLASDLDGQSLTKTGDIFGSPLYMSPEQCLAQGVDHRSDIYSLGCSLFEALTGSPPFLGENPLSTMMLHQSTLPPSLKSASLGKDFPPNLDLVMHRLLEKNPDQRYQTMESVRDDLEDVQLGKKPRNCTRATNNDTMAKSVSPRTMRMLLGSIALVAILPIALILIQPKKVPEPSPVNDQISQTDSLLQTMPVGPRVERLASDRQVKVMDDRYCRVDRDPADGQMYRYFEFPERICLGDIRSSKYKSIHPAKGSFQIPLKQHLMLFVGADGLTNVTLLKHFGPGVFDGVWFTRQLDSGNEVLTGISSMADLKSIDAEQTDVDDTGLAIIGASFPKLTYLAVSNTLVTSEGLKKLPQLHQLHSLRLGGQKDGAAILKYIAGSKNLEFISMNACGLTDQDVKQLGSIKSLDNITLTNNPGVTDACLDYFTNLPNLHKLGLSGCKITPQAIPKLVKLKHLRFLTVPHKYFSTMDIEKLKAALPNIRAEHLVIETGAFERNNLIEEE